jgi:glutathione S-transferase
MKLYYAPFACSFSAHITAREAGLHPELVAVALSSKRTAAGEDFLAISPKGKVPALRLESGALLTEVPAVLQYLADSAPASGLLPATGSLDRYRVLESINYIGTEIHKQCFYPMFAPDAPPEAKSWARGQLDTRLAYLAAQLESRSFIAAPHFTIADAYLTWALTLCQKIGVQSVAQGSLGVYVQAMHARPAVQAAMAAEASAARPG